MKYFSRIYCWSYTTVLTVVVCALLVCTVIAILIQKKHDKLWHGINIILWCVSVVAVLKFTILGRTSTFTHEYSIRTIEMIRVQPELIREMVMNIFLYVPFGIFGAFALPHKIRHKAFFCILFALIFSIIVELIQYFFGMGLCEPSDVVTNTLGAAIGSLSYILSNWLRKRKEKRKVENT